MRLSPLCDNVVHRDTCCSICVLTARLHGKACLWNLTKRLSWCFTFDKRKLRLNNYCEGNLFNLETGNSCDWCYITSLSCRHRQGERRDFSHLDSLHQWASTTRVSQPGAEAAQCRQLQTAKHQKDRLRRFEAFLPTPRPSFFSTNPFCFPSSS